MWENLRQRDRSRPTTGTTHATILFHLFSLFFLKPQIYSRLRPALVYYPRDRIELRAGRISGAVNIHTFANKRDPCLRRVSRQREIKLIARGSVVRSFSTFQVSFQGSFETLLALNDEQSRRRDKCKINRYLLLYLINSYLSLFSRWFNFASFIGKNNPVENGNEWRETANRCLLV